jgi:glyoxylase-like metal-dependent hydrolase (beta-lactamase superfamily II)
VTSTGQDVRSVIESDASGLGICAKDIEAIIWSHNHFDHIGDPSRFPSTTELVVGPGVKSLSWPGYPSKIDGALLDSDAAGRPIREIQFSSTGLKVGGFDAFDYFGDGSFYLLDAPGHCKGHMCGLARTCVDPPTFIFMAADACHHPGLLRPTAQLPLPGDSLQHPFLTLPKGPLMEDYETAQKTLCKIQTLDALENVFVILAHDASIKPHLPLFPASVNEWKPRNIAKETKWLFCKGIDSSNI